VRLSADPTQLWLPGAVIPTLTMDTGMSSVATQWAATNELARSLDQCKPVAAETWVVPRPHQFEGRRIVVKASRISRGVDVL
jgi:hypothetical protein